MLACKTLCPDTDSGCFNLWIICPVTGSGHFCILTTFCPDWHPAILLKIQFFCPDRDQAISAIAQGPGKIGTDSPTVVPCAILACSILAKMLHVVPAKKFTYIHMSSVLSQIPHAFHSSQDSKPLDGQGGTTMVGSSNSYLHKVVWI